MLIGRPYSRQGKRSPGLNSRVIIFIFYNCWSFMTDMTYPLIINSDIIRIGFVCITVSLNKYMDK
jgi:hypothetical protein